MVGEILTAEQFVCSLEELVSFSGGRGRRLCTATSMCPLCLRSPITVFIFNFNTFHQFGAIQGRGGLRLEENYFGHEKERMTSGFSARS